MIAWTAVTGLLLIAPPSNSSAGLGETVREDLRPVSGYVVRQQEGEYLVDLDARHGLRVGDLLSVVTKGPEVIHPLTKEVLGRLDVAKAVLQVTQMKSGFSLARPLSGAAAIADGDLVRRFAFLTAAFLGPAPQSKALYEELREALPELEWQGLFSAGERPANSLKTDLVFTLENKELRLLDREGQTLRTWPYPVAAEPVPQKPVAEAARQPAPAAPALPPPQPVPKPSGEEVSGVRWPAGEVDFGSFTSLGDLPSRVLMSAATREQDLLLLATVDGTYLRVFAVAGGLRQLAVTEMRNETASPIAVAWWRPEKTGGLYLVVTAGEENFWSSRQGEETQLSGAIYEFAGQSLRQVAADIPYFMGTFDRDGDGLPETLLGQEFDKRNGYGRNFLLKREGEKVRAGAPDFALPGGFTVMGSTLADLTGDGKREIAVVQKGVLSIYSGTKRIYHTSREMGGTISTLTYDANSGSQKNPMLLTLSLEVPPFPHDIDGDGVPELLVVGSETSSVKVPGIGPGIRKSWVAVVKFKGGNFRRGRLGEELENPIQGIWADGKQVYLVESKTESFLSKKGRSTLLTHPLGRPGG